MYVIKVIIYFYPGESLFVQIIINLFKPSPWSLFELVERFQQSTTFILRIWVVESFRDEYVNWLF